MSTQPTTGAGQRSSTASQEAATGTPTEAHGEGSGTARTPGQLPSLLRATHPRQAVAIAVVVGLLVALMGRPAALEHLEGPGVGEARRIMTEVLSGRSG